MPYKLDLSNFVFDSFLAFCLGTLFAVTINAEAQAFVAQILGDLRSDDKNRFHFNAFRHLDVLGTIAFFVLGFGWPRHVDIDSSRFRRPRLYSIVVRVAGPAANFLLASILSSISLIIEQFSIDPEMFKIVLGVNLMVAVANLLPIPPLAAGSILNLFISARFSAFGNLISRVGSYVLVGLLIIDGVERSGIIDKVFSPLFTPVFLFLTKSYAFG
jgi:Zn-dependent protease